MESPKKTKNIHFSISSFKKTKPLSSEIQIDNELKKLEFKRSASYVIPKKFVPKLRPMKTTINPSFLMLNEEKSSNSDLKNNKTEIENKNDILSNEDKISNSSISDVNSDIEEQIFSEKIINTVKYTAENSNNINLNSKGTTNEANIFNKINSCSSSNYITEKKSFKETKNNSNSMKTKEYIDSDILGLKKKFSFEDIKNNASNNKDIQLKKESNINKSELFHEKKCQEKKRPFLIFDVLTQALKKKHITNT